MNPEPPASKPQPNGTAQLLTTLAQSGDKWIQFGILCLVGISGFGNWFATQNSGQQNLAGQERIKQEVREQINDMHGWIEDNRRFIKESVDEFHRGNADSSANRKLLERIEPKMDELLSTLQKHDQTLKRHLGEFSTGGGPHPEQ